MTPQTDNISAPDAGPSPSVQRGIEERPESPSADAGPNSPRSPQPPSWLDCDGPPKNGWKSVRRSPPADGAKVDVWVRIYASPRPMGMGDAFCSPDAWRENGAWMHMHKGQPTELFGDYVTHWRPRRPELWNGAAPLSAPQGAERSEAPGAQMSASPPPGGDHGK